LLGIPDSRWSPNPTPSQQEVPEHNIPTGETDPMNVGNSLKSLLSSGIAPGKMSRMNTSLSSPSMATLAQILLKG